MHPAGGLPRGLQINDATCGWHPSVPVRLYAARADRDSVIANAWHCQAALRAHGANIPVIDVGPVDHVSSLVLAALPKLPGRAAARACPSRGNGYPLAGPAQGAPALICCSM